MPWMIDHWRDLAIALVLAILFAWVADYIRIGSRTRDIVRRFESRRAGKSVVKLEKRIRDLERLRTLANSDRWIYLNAFQSVFVSFMSIAFGLAAREVTRWMAFIDHRQLDSFERGTVVIFFILSAIIATMGLFQVARDPAEAVKREISNIMRNIEYLEGKLFKLKAKQTNTPAETKDDSGSKS